MTPSFELLHRSGYNACSLCGREKRVQSRMCNFCRYARPSIVQPEDSSIRLISLTRGLFTVIPFSEFDRFNRWTWFAAWAPTSHSFYAVRSECVEGQKNQRRVYMAREILGLGFGDKRVADHRLHNTLDNRLFVDGEVNLRIATKAENCRNRKRPLNSTTGLKGVSPAYTHHGKYFYGWKAQIQVDGVNIYLGTFPIPELAHEAYKAAALFYHKEFAYWEG